MNLNPILRTVMVRISKALIYLMINRNSSIEVNFFNSSTTSIFDIIPYNYKIIYSKSFFLSSGTAIKKIISTQLFDHLIGLFNVNRTRPILLTSAGIP